VLAAGEQAPIVRFRRALFRLVVDRRYWDRLREILTKYPDMEFAGAKTPARALDGNARRQLRRSGTAFWPLRLVQ